MKHLVRLACDGPYGEFLAKRVPHIPPRLWSSLGDHPYFGETPNFSLFDLFGVELGAHSSDGGGNIQ